MMETVTRCTARVFRGLFTHTLIRMCICIILNVSRYEEKNNYLVISRHVRSLLDDDCLRDTANPSLVLPRILQFFVSNRIYSRLMQITCAIVKCETVRSPDVQRQTFSGAKLKAQASKVLDRFEFIRERRETLIRLIEERLHLVFPTIFQSHRQENAPDTTYVYLLGRILKRHALEHKHQHTDSTIR